MGRKTVFISDGYDQDSELSRKVAEHLRSMGCTVFRGEDSIHLGDDWVEKIDKALDEADFVVLNLGGGP